MNETTTLTIEANEEAYMATLGKMAEIVAYALACEQPRTQQAKLVALAIEAAAIDEAIVRNGGIRMSGAA